ncbi:replication initiation protein [Clostridium tagluense]|uniref:replication initiation protein n=1 Tax=Clostridium tagluense TaxID=360422 RepID=UPI001CF1C11B|nr:RepB family plasmid replication initiator protein [Clostridium tagluense]MCB2299462.1 RepB family plasmid replication initiator protein [Clostridium tagluense]
MIKKGKHIAVRPNELIEARYNLSVSQNDIMDMVLAKIEDDNNYLYELNINDYKHLYKTDTSNIYRNLEKATKGMEGTGFYLLTNNDKGVEKETFFVWFASIEYVRSEGKITFEIGTKLKGLLLEMKKRIYYKIEYPINFTSIYSKRVYYYLKRFEDTGWRIDNLDILRKKLQCPKSYEKYSFFRIKVLDMAMKEINNFSDISFKFEETKIGRKVTGIKFIIKQNQNNKARNEIAATSTVLREEVGIQPQKNIDNIKLVKAIISEDITDLEAIKIFNIASGDINIIIEKYNIVRQLNNVKNLVGTVITAIKEDWSFPKGKIKVGTFNDYDQRSYDFIELEKKLLGWEN